MKYITSVRFMEGLDLYFCLLKMYAFCYFTYIYISFTIVHDYNSINLLNAQDEFHFFSESAEDCPPMS